MTTLVAKAFHVQTLPSGSCGSMDWVTTFPLIFLEHIASDLYDFYDYACTPAFMAIGVKCN